MKYFNPFGIHVPLFSEQRELWDPEDPFALAFAMVKWCRVNGGGEQVLTQFSGHMTVSSRFN